MRTPVGSGHPAQRILESVNRWYTKGDLRRATEIYLNLWGSAFWALECGEDGQREIWPLRPDRMSIVPGRTGQVAYTPEEIVWLRYFNPL